MQNAEVRNRQVDFCPRPKEKSKLTSILEENDGYGHYYGAPSGPILTGETDECPQGGTSQYLVVRDLGDTVTEEILSKGVMKLFVDKTTEPTRNTNPLNKLKSTAPTNSTVGLGAKPGSLRRVFLIRDRRSDESRRYGFAEFATLEDAIAAMAKYYAYGDKFTIASKIVKVGFIHAGVFVPADESTNPAFTFAPVVNPAIRLRYWDERVYPSVFDVSIEQAPENPILEKREEKSDGTAAEKTSTSNKDFKGFKLKKSKKDEAAAAAIKIAMNPEIQRWKMKAEELRKQKAADSKYLPDDRTKDLAPDAIIQAEKTGEVHADGPVNPHWTDQYVSYADWDRMVCVVCDWEVPAQNTFEEKGYSQYRREDILIQHEARVHNQYKDPDMQQKAAAKLSAAGKEPRTIVRRIARLKSEALPKYVSYADFDSPHCHICTRNFKRIEVLWRHEQESQLHKRMLSDPKNIDRAIEELKAKEKTPHRMGPDKAARQQQAEQQPQYRDRARERRQALRQPNKPTASTGEKRKEPAEPVPEEVPLAKKSKGAGMLARMGWTAGAGLGAEGTGRTEAIAVDAYAEGVGLGAEGGKIGDAAEEAARKTRNNPLDFLEKTRDKARERFERLQ